MDLASHFRVIAQNWVRILIISAIIGGVVFLASSLQADEYQAKATLTAKPGNIISGQSEAEAATFAAQTYAKYVDTRPVLVSALRDSKLKMSLAEFKSHVSASADGDLGFVNVTATGPMPKEAEIIARFVSDQLKQSVTLIGDAKIQDIVRPIKIER